MLPKKAPDAECVGLESDGRLGQKFLKSRDGGKKIANLVGAGCNDRLVLKWLRVLLARIMAAVLKAIGLRSTATIACCT